MRFVTKERGGTYRASDGTRSLPGVHTLHDAEIGSNVRRF